MQDSNQTKRDEIESLNAAIRRYAAIAVSTDDQLETVADHNWIPDASVNEDEKEERLLYLERIREKSPDWLAGSERKRFNLLVFPQGPDTIGITLATVITLGYTDAKDVRHEQSSTFSYQFRSEYPDIVYGFLTVAIGHMARMEYRKSPTIEITYDQQLYTGSLSPDAEKAREDIKASVPAVRSTRLAQPPPPIRTRPETPTPLAEAVEPPIEAIATAPAAATPPPNPTDVLWHASQLSKSEYKEENDGPVNALKSELSSAQIQSRTAAAMLFAQEAERVGFSTNVLSSSPTAKNKYNIIGMGNLLKRVTPLAYPAGANPKNPWFPAAYIWLEGASQLDDLHNTIEATTK